jgi:hypothetical protein
MEAPCLGTQLVTIIRSIQAFTQTSTWYGCDIEVNGEFPFKHCLQGWTAKKIGANECIIKLAQDTDQFLSGVFLALPQDHGEALNQEFGTEDEPFRDIEEAILEIRAFDTSYFEVYSNDKALMDVLANSFNTEIIHRPT